MRNKAIIRAYPEAVSVNAGKQAWDADGKEIELDEELILQEIEKIKEEYKAVEYKELRRLEYPKIEDQLDLLYHKGIDGWKEEIQKVKDKYPKPVVEEPVVEAVVEEPIVEEPKEELKVEQPIEEVPSE